MAGPTTNQLDGVYLGDFEGFVARRDALAKELDGDAAKQVKALRKPSRTAWAINQLAGHARKLRTQLLKAGTALRGAQEQLMAGEGDREAMLKARERERAAVDDALEAIAVLAAEAGQAFNDAARERVRQTLHAVALDDDVREQFESARLTTDHEASGLGSVPSAGSARGGGTGKARKRTREQQGRQRRRRELEAAEKDAARRARELEAAELGLEEARQTAKRAEGDLKRAQTARDKADKAADQAEAKAAKLRED